MEHTSNGKIKQSHTTQIALVTVSAIIFFVMVCLLIKNSSAWLEDRGQWAESTYSVGRIDYNYTINNQIINTDTTQDLVVTVPIIGGVKINDSAVSTAGTSYEMYAEENFNEGVTVVHIEVDNESDFPISGTYTFAFENMFDSTVNGNKDIFYLILPKNATVDTNAKTITVDNASKTYKAYVKSIMTSHSTYDQMVSSLTGYYNTNPALKTNNFSMTTANDSSGKMMFDILFWSEYNELPFVSSGKLMSPNPDSGVNGTFNFSINISQKTSK